METQTALTHFNLTFTFDEQEQEKQTITKSASDLQLLCQGILDVCSAEGALMDLCKQVIFTPLLLTAEQLNNFFQTVFEHSDIVRNDVFFNFLADAVLKNEKGAEIPKFSAVDILLQSVPSKQIYIPRRCSYFEDYFVEAKSTIVWKFCITGGYDIEFGIVMKTKAESPANDDTVGTVEAIMEADEALHVEQFSVNTEIKSPHRVTTPLANSLVFSNTGTCIEGSYTALQNGYCRLTFNNTYSIVNGKYVELVVAVVTNDAVEASILAVEELTAVQNKHRAKLFTKILDSKSVSCTAEGPFEKPNDVPSAQSPRDVEKVILSTMHADGDLARVISASGGTRAGTGSDPATGDVVLLPSNSSTSALVADNLKEDQLNNESKAGAQPLWFSHAISVAANLPLVNRWISAPSSSNVVEENELSSAELPIQRSASGWKIFGEAASQSNTSTQIDYDTDDDDGTECLLEKRGVQLSCNVPSHEELQESIAQISMERDHARAKGTRYELLADQLRRDLLLAESKISEKEQRIDSLIQTANAASEVRMVNQLRIQELEKQLMQCSSDLNLLLHERDLFSLQGLTAQNTVSNLSKLHEEEVRGHRDIILKYAELQKENKGCLDRILELEALLNECNQSLQIQIERSGDVEGLQATLNQREQELKDCKVYLEDLNILLSQIQSQRAEEKYINDQNQKKLVNANRQCLGELEQLRSQGEELKGAVSLLKSQKKMLVAELRKLRDRGVYTVPAVGDKQSTSEPIVTSIVPEQAEGQSDENADLQLEEIERQKQAILHLLDIDPDNRSLLTTFGSLTREEVSLRQKLGKKA